MAKKDSFVLYNSYYDVIEDLTMEQRGALFTAILQHACGEEQEELDPIVKIAYRVIAAQLDRDRKKWEDTCAKRVEAGKRGGIASGQSRRQSKQSEANEANALDTKQSQAKRSKVKQTKLNMNMSLNLNMNMFMILSMIMELNLYRKRLVRFSIRFERNS